MIGTRGNQLDWFFKGFLNISGFPLCIQSLKQRERPRRGNHLCHLKLWISQSSLIYEVLIFFLKEIRVQQLKQNLHFYFYKLSWFLGFLLLQFDLISTTCLIFPHFIKGQFTARVVKWHAKGLYWLLLRPRRNSYLLVQTPLIHSISINCSMSQEHTREENKVPDK